MQVGKLADTGRSPEEIEPVLNQEKFPREQMLSLLVSIFTAGLHVTSLTIQRCEKGAPICMKQMTRPPAAKGFAAKKKASKPAPVVPLDPSCAAAMLVLEEGERDLEHYLNPAHFADPATMEDITRRLQAGDLVVIKDAFRPEFAEMVFTELSASSVAWELNEAYFPDGYAHLHNNVYERSSWSARLNATLDMFAAKASSAFISKLTGRDCTGDTTGAPSWYDTGHHSLPHTDWVGQRTVAYVWHLSKNWKPEWGGVSATVLDPAEGHRKELHTDPSWRLGHPRTHGPLNSCLPWAFSRVRRASTGRSMITPWPRTRRRSTRSCSSSSRRLRRTL